MFFNERNQILENSSMFRCFQYVMCNSPPSLSQLKWQLRHDSSHVLCVVSSHVQHQYHFVYEVKNMTEAQSYCRDKYTDLATIDDMEDVKTLTDMMDLNKMVLDEDGQATAWIGLYHDVNSWRWSDRDAEVEFTNWAEGEPSSGSVEYCTEMYDPGVWNDLRCDRTRQAVCSSVRGSDVKFILINTTMNWTEAQSYCRTYYTDLATVRNEAENQEVKNLTDGQSVWIGLFRDWKWSDGSNSSFRYWASGEPNNNAEKKEACVVMKFDRSGRWGDWTCDRNRPFICYKDPTTEEPNWTLRPFPTSVPSASTPATTQSLISSSGSFTPSSSFPETTEKFAEAPLGVKTHFIPAGTEGGSVTRVCNAAVYGSRKFFCKDECKKEEDILVETAENRAQRGRYIIEYREGSTSGLYVTITQLEKSDTGRYKCGYGRALSPDSFDWFPIIVVDAVSGVSLPGYFWPLVASMSLIIVMVAVVLLFVYKLMMRRNSGLNTRETSDSRNMELSVVYENPPPVYYENRPPVYYENRPPVYYDNRPPVYYDNRPPVSMSEDHVYQSLDAFDMDPDQTYSPVRETTNKQ
ncbi:uncharacterized protein LOC133987778 [Scomber scombrus]|uniref:uncharacterized protein LOC133987778 n=1 Tax=Scomber scombrus TaxID=13677 RepID=UPI002DDC2753|nr:uncharacterized protein LOC133987778 [Scomber scombrus]